MHEHAPSLGSDQELNGNASAMRAEMVAALPADHPVGAAATIELWTALPQTEKQPVAGIESQLRRSRVEREMLGQFAARAFHAKRKRIARNRDALPPALDGPRTGEIAQASNGRLRGSVDQRAVGRQRHGLAVSQRLDRDAHSAWAHSEEGDFQRVCRRVRQHGSGGARQRQGTGGEHPLESGAACEGVVQRFPLVVSIPLQARRNREIRRDAPRRHRLTAQRYVVAVMFFR